MHYRDWLNEGADPDDLRAMRPVRALLHVDDLPRIARGCARRHRAGWLRTIGRRWHPATNDRWARQAWGLEDDGEGQPF